MAMDSSTGTQSQKHHTPTPVDDAHKLAKTVTRLSRASSVTMPVAEIFDIENVPVENDPRAWSPLRKAC